MRPASVGFQCPEEGSGPPVRTARDLGVGGLRQVAPVTFGLIAVNVVVFVLCVLDGSSLLGSSTGLLGDHLELVSVTTGYGGHVVLPGVAEGQYWRLLTSMFVHYGLIHIGFNMLALYVVGGTLERRLGTLRYLGVYLAAGLGGSVASYLFANPLQASGGASGAIFGLFGAYAVLARRDRLDVGPILGTIGLNLVITFTIPGISILAHVGGLVVGGLLGVVIAYAPRGRAAQVTAAAFVVVALLLVGLAAGRTHVLRDRYGPFSALRGATGPVQSQPPAGPAGARPPGSG